MTFSKDINDFVLNVDKANEKIVRNTVNRLWRTIIKESPVGEVDGGRFRSNWFPSGSTPSDEVNLRLRSENAALSRVSKSVKSQKDYTVFHLTNNLPYAEVIEFGGYLGDGPNTVGGYSKQAPSGVVRVNIRNFNKLIKEQAAKLKL